MINSKLRTGAFALALLSGAALFSGAAAARPFNDYYGGAYHRLGPVETYRWHRHFYQYDGPAYAYDGGPGNYDSGPAIAAGPVGVGISVY